MLIKNLFCILLFAVSCSAVEWSAPRPADSGKFNKLFQNVGQSVVTILVTSEYVDRGLGNPFMGMPEFRDFFDFFGGQGLALPRHRIEQSMGSGVIISKDGLILTCAHVVRSNDQVIVSTSDDLSYKAKVLVVDEEEDLALLKIQNTERVFKPVKLGNSDTVIEGDEVAALGNPVSVGLWFTQGIVSSAFNTHGGGNFIGTSAMVNPGNSGGGLFNLDGDLIGLPSAIKSRTGMSHGINFAVPINLAKALLQAYEQNQKTIQRPELFAKFQRIDSDAMKALNRQSSKGALVVGFEENSPLKTVQMKKADLITSFNGFDVKSPEALIYRVKLAPFGKRIPLQFIRENKEYTAEIVFEPILSESVNLSQSPFEGASFKTMPSPFEDIKRNFLVVDKVKRGSKAERLGLQKGTLIIAVNQQLISTAKDLETIVNKKQSFFDVQLFKDGVQTRITVQM